MCMHLSMLSLCVYYDLYELNRHVLIKSTMRKVDLISNLLLPKISAFILDLNMKMALKERNGKY